jgi:very-short-patch-repair endonuclease
VATIGRTNPYARRLRREATDAERRLWYHLRNRQLGGFKFRQQETIGTASRISPALSAS